jgi:hypothetical protein
MARRANPSDPELGQRKVIGLFESQECLLEHLGFDANVCLQDELKAIQTVKATKPSKLTKTTGRMPNVLNDKCSS